MMELFVGIFTCVFLYWLGGIWMPEHKPIEQELIKTNTREPYKGSYQGIETYLKIIEGDEE